MILKSGTQQMDSHLSISLYNKPMRLDCITVFKLCATDATVHDARGRYEHIARGLNIVFHLAQVNISIDKLSFSSFSYLLSY